MSLILTKKTKAAYLFHTFNKKKKQLHSIFAGFSLSLDMLIYNYYCPLKKKDMMYRGGLLFQE